MYGTEVNMRTMILCCMFCAVCFAAAAAAPDQVLVLYNADYRIDQDDSEPGQDSREVAEYYVGRHTDPATGRKPWILGVTCIHGKDHLNQFRLPEDSSDNLYGLEFVGEGEPPKRWPVADSRQAQMKIPKADLEKVNLTTVTITVGRPDGSAKKVIFDQGAALKGYGVTETDQDGRLYSFDAKQAMRGTIEVVLEAKDKQGEPATSQRYTFYDIDDFALSITGIDKVRDDKNYLEDIELQVKDFLEDPKNATADGTLLKDHILYIVVCHGLPKVVTSIYGVGRGTGESLGDFGNGSSLQQRLMLAYLDPPAINYLYIGHGSTMARMPFERGLPARFIKYTRPFGLDGLRRQVLCNALAYGLLGNFNPYMHPGTFSNNDVKDMYDQARYADPKHRLKPPLYKSQQDQPPHFTTQTRKAHPKASFLYWCMRIDGRSPAIAKAQVDGAIYGTRYFTPSQGQCYNRLAGPLPIQPAVRLGLDELKELGFSLQPELNKPPAVIERPLLFSAFFSDGPRYVEEGEIAGQSGVLPGGIIHAIKSANGWMNNEDQFATYLEKMIEAGATVTAGLGGVGGAHITSASWWDDRIFYYHLFRGYELGEVLLMSTTYLDWVTAYIGDPLYRPNVLVNKPDTTPPALDGPIAVEVLPAKDSYCAILTAKLKQTPSNPEMAEMAADYGADRNKTNVTSNWRFSAQPHVILTGLKAGSTCYYTVHLSDGYANATKADGSFKVPAGTPSKLLHEDAPPADGKTKPLAAPKDGTPLFAGEAGRIDIEFTPQKNSFELAQMGGLAWDSSRLRVGSGTAQMHDPLKFEAGRRYRISARWRRRPLTREVYLIAADGTEFLAASNHSIPWGTKPAPDAAAGQPAARSLTREPLTREPLSGDLHFGDRNGDIRIHSVKVFDSADPAPHEHRKPYVHKFKLDEFNAKDGKRQ